MVKYGAFITAFLCLVAATIRIVKAVKNKRDRTGWDIAAISINLLGAVIILICALVV